MKNLLIVCIADQSDGLISGNGGGACWCSSGSGGQYGFKNFQNRVRAARRF